MQALLVSLLVHQLPEEILDDVPCFLWPFAASCEEARVKLIFLLCGFTFSASQL